MIDEILIRVMFWSTKNLPKLDDHQLPDHETISMNTTEKEIF